MEGHAPACPLSEFAAILVDAPCSNTGVLRRRVDVRWRLNEKCFARMAALQVAILRRALPLRRAGGRLVYSTCSIEPEENAGVVGRLLEKFPALQFEETRDITTTEETDGAYAALLRR